MTRARVAALLLPTMLSGLVAPLAAEGSRAEMSHHGWRVGGDGWILEQFGPNVTILRSRTVGTDARDAALFLSCSSGEMRLRVTVPESLPGRRGKEGSGTALVRARPLDGEGAGGALGRFAVVDARQVEFRAASAEPRSIVASFVRMLDARAREIELMIGFGAAPPRFGQPLVAYSLLPQFASGDAAMLRHVALACATGGNDPHAGG